MTTSSLNVLAVDDEPLILMTLVDMLEDLGHNVKSAPNALVALDQLKKQKFDLLVTDQSMPSMSGQQLIEKAQEIDPSIRVVLATGYTEMFKGKNGHIVQLTKPFDERSLVAALDRLYSQNLNP